MAVVKHLNNHSGDYRGALRYLMYAHDEVSGKPLKDANGNYVLRERFLADGINCEPYSFELECALANAEFKKNNNPREITSHHYIISFDPQDSEFGLTEVEAHSMSLSLAREWFGGHQAIVFTHPDGDNHAGNIHTHVVINSLRIKDEPKREGMEQPWFWKAGYKHRAAEVFVDAFKQAVMDMCRERGLNQVDLLAKRGARVSEQEYWAERRAQIADARRQAEAGVDNLCNFDGEGVDGDVAGVRQKRADPQKGVQEKAKHSPSSQTCFTRNAQIRKAVRESVAVAANMEDFERIMRSEYGIEVSMRGVSIAYKHPAAAKVVTGRRLGLDFEKPMIECKIAERSAGLKERKPLELVSVLEGVINNGKSLAYNRKVRISNVQKLAETVAFLQRANLTSLDELYEACDFAVTERDVAYAEYSATETKISNVNRAIKARGMYFANKHVVGGYGASKDTRAYYNAHSKEFEAFKFAKRELSILYGKEEIPTMPELKAAKAQLLNERNTKYEKWCDARLRLRELTNARKNVEQVLGQSKQRDIEAER